MQNKSEKKMSNYHNCEMRRSMMAFKDNRQFIEALEKNGEIVCIKQEVDWELEAAAIARRSNEMQGPACLFEKMKDYFNS